MTEPLEEACEEIGVERKRVHDSLDYLPPEGSYSGLAIGALASLLVALFSAALVLVAQPFMGLEAMIPVWLLIPVASLAALVTGLAALDSMDRRPEITRGRRVAWVGIVGGGLLCLVQCVLFRMAR
jgi:hypothetical protein